MKFAAIDIGSNAVRLLLCNVIEEKDGHVSFKKAELIRIPLRLGEDSFIKGEISEEKAQKLITAMKAFKNLIEVYDALDYRACATSAMRDAKNGAEIINKVYEQSGIKIELISGSLEADIVYSNHVADDLDKGSSYLYVDIGGGSTQISLFSKNKCIASHSFNIGTVRMLHNQIQKEYWTSFKEWVKETTEKYKPIIAIGSGGNINKLYKMSDRKDGKPISYRRLKELSEQIEAYTMEERISVLSLNPDRADVIIPASKIALTVMKMADIEKMIVPQIGLSDGIVHQLYEEYKEKKGIATTA